MAFTGHAKAQQCKYCFSLSHQAMDCEWVPTTGLSAATSMTEWTPRTRGSPVCKSWNFSNQATRDFRNCTYQHVCLQCALDASALEKGHKLTNCLKRQARSQTQLVQQQPPSQQQALPTAINFRASAHIEGRENLNWCYDYSLHPTLLC